MRMSGLFTKRPKSELVNTLPLAEIIHPALTGVACQDADWTAGLAPQWGISEICSFVTQHDATDVAGFEGERNYHVHNHRPRVWPHLHLVTWKTVWGRPPGHRLPQSVCKTRQYLYKMSETVLGKLIWIFVILIGVLTWTHFVIITDLIWKTLRFDWVWHIGEVFSMRRGPGFHCSGCRPCVWRCVGDADVINGVTHGGGWQWYATNNEHRCILLTAFWTHQDTPLVWPSPHVAAWWCTTQDLDIATGSW